MWILSVSMDLTDIFHIIERVLFKNEWKGFLRFSPKGVDGAEYQFFNELRGVLESKEALLASV